VGLRAGVRTGDVGFILKMKTNGNASIEDYTFQNYWISMDENAGVQDNAQLALLFEAVTRMLIRFCPLFCTGVKLGR
jgi:hypothetical protein